MEDKPFVIDAEIPLHCKRIYTIWHVSCDEAYYVSKYKVRHENQLVAIRTISGQGSMVTTSNTIVLDENTLVFVKFPEIIEYYCTSDHWEFYWFEFSLYSNAENIELEKINPMSFSKKEKELLEECLASVVHIDGHLKNYAASLFASLYNYWTVSLINNSLPNNKLFNKALDIINSDFHCNIPAVAKKLRITERTLRNIFYRNIGISPIKYIKERRMAIAKSLLSTSSLNIKEISLIVGYKNQFFFSKEFKNNFGISPSEYAKQWRHQS